MRGEEVRDKSPTLRWRDEENEIDLGGGKKRKRNVKRDTHIIREE